MTYTVIWERAAAEGLKRPRRRDGDRVRPLVQAVNALAAHPEPPHSSKLGSTHIRRLRVGPYRATYEIDGDTIAIKVLMVGSTPVR
ncbi:type II toxin-antitoxin system RelE family toxin [Streptomyces johnsoniae]|uniref:Type II toxin-antitoxin system RelE/ParE family toxin n=1 Tax=Streptomyces johnsoniae TaxID=3075532 RepID=A0ABU2RZ38_9ACTN|nr:type II toxin-antitoxin system RelE/ParE family toxin [Streptomyces sp. DSM 41886]MDT0441691.1 type II toxin-antitoxin system RelE/ParE family toxin [Streptomyces sp. DSM 41886]